MVRPPCLAVRTVTVSASPAAVSRKCARCSSWRRAGAGNSMTVRWGRRWRVISRSLEVAWDRRREPREQGGRGRGGEELTAPAPAFSPDLLGNSPAGLLELREATENPLAAKAEEREGGGGASVMSIGRVGLEMSSVRLVSGPRSWT